MNDHASIDLTELIKFSFPQFTEEKIFNDEVNLNTHTSNADRTEVLLRGIAQIHRLIVRLLII